MDLKDVAQFVKDQGWTKFYIAIIEQESGTLGLEVEVVPMDIISITWDANTTDVNDARKCADYLGDCLSALGLEEFIERDDWEENGF